MFNEKRIFMAEVDAGGNSAPAAPADVVDVPQAQGAAVTMTKTEFDAAIASAAEQAISRAKDGIFAEARRTFTAPNKTKTKTDDAPPAATPQLDPIKLRSLDRALSKSGLASSLTDTQYQRAEKAFVSEDPGDAESWVKDYFAGFGSPATTTQAAPAAAQPAAPKLPQNSHPASDRGSPPPSQVPLVEADLVSMSETDRSALLKEKGLVWYRQQLAKQLKGRRITLR